MERSSIQALSEKVVKNSSSRNIRAQKYQILIRNLNILSKNSELENLENQFCELLNPITQPISKINKNACRFIYFHGKI